MPNKERLRLWTAALRDENLIQGFGCLAQRRNEGEPWKQCCLDVACQVAIANGLSLDQEVRESATYKWMRAYIERDTSYAPQTSVLPVSAMHWYGLEGDRAVNLSDTRTAAGLNDDDGLTFAEIADIIDEYFELNERG